MGIDRKRLHKIIDKHTERRRKQDLGKLIKSNKKIGCPYTLTV